MPIYLTFNADFDCLNILIENEEPEGNTVNIKNQRPVNHGLFVVNNLEDKNSPPRVRSY